jgi:hypothetical protein
MRWVICLIVLSLSYLAYFRTDFFSPSAISAPLSSSFSQNPSEEAEQALAQPYRYLGKGRQCYVFISQDQQTVIKFFNKKYLTIPWYARWIPNEKEKREKRQKYYRESYPLAEIEASKILYLHLGKSEKKLPCLSILDRASRAFSLDLHQTPFVLQKRGDPFYPGLESLLASQGKETFDRAIEQFVSLIGCRIDKKIGDADHDVEHNFGILEGQVFHLDPGRFFKNENLWQPDVLHQEWWSATHRFREWLLEKYPESVTVLDLAIGRHACKNTSF